MITQGITLFMQLMMKLVLLSYTSMMMLQNWKIMITCLLVNRKKVWKMFFDGSYSREGYGVGL
jgi:hypothetical protein